MKLALIILIVVSCLELLVWTKLGWRYRRYLAGVILLIQSVAVGLILGFAPNVWSSLLLILSGYRVINLLRLVEGRMPADYLFSVSRRTSLRLILGQVVIGLGWVLSRHVHIRLDTYLAILSGLDLSVVFILAYSLKRSIRTTKPPRLKTHYAARDLPSISVLIPARNETADLEQCLTSLVASSYPKLEILVLDDCSQNKRTPEIIKSFAQAGVRFIAGDMPPESWLAKNFAYKQLADQASGEILVFAGVDTRFSPDTLTSLVEILLEKKKTMASFMPINKLPAKFDFLSSIVQPTRYAWELALPRRLVNRPPVLSTCWAIYAKKLEDYGSFKAVSRTSIPEGYFARKAIADKDGYSFIRSTSSIGLRSEKTFLAQRDTAIRTRYPQTHRKLELVALLSLIEAVVFLMPFLSAVWGIINLNWLLLIFGAMSLVWLSLVYELLCRLTYSSFILKSLLVWPVVAIYDIGLINYSMWQYEFKEVIWKGRNICLPVMRASALDQEQLS
jgi:glycosyltransferase involved in cell wall biosynthesis